MSASTVAQDARSRNWSPAMRRTVEAMRRYPLMVCKPARLDTACDACGCPVKPNTLPEWPAVDLHAVDPL